MAIQLTADEFSQLLKRLNESWRVYAPKAEYRGGRFSDTDNIIYQPVSHFDEIVWREKSHMSPNTVITPITETLFYFDQQTIQIAETDTRPLLIFARSCDIHAMSRLDAMYLHNGPAADNRYQAIRDRIQFVLMECEQSFENCFCVSMGTNRTDDYAAAVHFDATGARLTLNDERLSGYLDGLGQRCEHQVQFVEQNLQQVQLPDSVCDDPQQIRDILVDHPLWADYQSRCIGCGRCTTGCPTCTCYSVFDVAYQEQPQRGERRRQWASCMVPGFSDMAGGHGFRANTGTRLRYRALHKVNDFKDRFGIEHMCVGCGRCDDRCPQYIKFSAVLNRMTDAVRQALVGEANHE
ncbi:anaerobic sulfite reductase subunit AsrA [Pectobacteriaceae bacterium CE90]|nr:anaerobic sulfite reductase subunit AsrA [Prodigiosinella sp. LS101]WJV54397.1 anaerobic sulfite reductase subunit AsrA [Prodigiosinella sp. LS101]WJV58758.1 anaerobic sulfite reductase subunit AsrA [Pectobacteriaceae bacterium C111]WJY14568.1 anaerobic sulfite reductase subunit AsrA [Pectobacteriaceae bacterium CE90]